MATSKAILEKIKIENQVQDLLTRSNGDLVKVVYNGVETTLSSALGTILASVNNLPTSANVDSKIKTAIDNLIGGAPATYDTLKEIADYIASNEEVMDTLNTLVGKKADKETVDSIQAAVQALGSLAKKNAVAESDLDATLAQKINNAANGNHSHTNKAVLDGITSGKVSAWDAKADKTVATSSAAGLLSSSDKQRLDALRGVRYGTDVPSDLQNGELFVQIVNEA